MKIDINPEITAIAWGGGIDDTLGTLLLIQQYGASALNILSLASSSTVVDMAPYTVELMGHMKIDSNKFTYLNETARRYAYRHFIPSAHADGKISPFFVRQDVLTDAAAILYYLLENKLNTYLHFMTEENMIRVREDHIAVRHFQYFVPDEYDHYRQRMLSDPMSFLKLPFHSNDITRHDVMEMYYELGVHHLLPLTRSCGVKAKQKAYNTSLMMEIEHINSNVHCGVCPRCLKRKYGFKSIGVNDPTTYLA